MYPYHEKVRTDESRVYPMNTIIPMCRNDSPVDPPSDDDDDDQYFNFRINNIHWDWHVYDKKADLISHTKIYDFYNISKKSINPMAITRLLICARIPSEAYDSLTAMILDVMEDMIYDTHQDHKKLFVGIDVHIDYFYDCGVDKSSDDSSSDDDSSDDGGDGVGDYYDEAEVEEDPDACTIV